MPNNIVIECACDEQCGRSMTLTADNRMILHGEDGRMVEDWHAPEWLAEAIRSAVKRQAELGGDRE
jgi:hypothetical protein